MSPDPSLTLFVGRFHPVLVHSPIALLLLVALIAWWIDAGATLDVRIGLVENE